MLTSFTYITPEDFVKCLTPVIALVLSTIATAQAVQSTPAPAEHVALSRCAALADAGKENEAVEPGRVAESLFTKRLSQNPRDVDALVGAARAKSQCLLPSAGMLGQGELSSDAMDLLDQALQVQPDHWLARFILASIAYRSPSFLGRGPRAEKEFDTLLRMQGDRTDNPTFARVFALRGMQLSRQGQADSARALWTRGAALFPHDAELQELAQRKKTDTTRRDSPATGDSASPSQNLSAVQVNVSSAPPRALLPSVKDVTRSQVLMTAGGTADVLQSVQMQPGATRVGEGGDVYTRGGDVGETALVLNGGRILSLARFEGLNGSMFGASES
jgi:tetratricopeptide (TPR) repeat protein